MADLTLEILTNKEKYPDDREIVLGDGEKVTVKEFRDRLQPRAEFTKASEAWKQKEGEYQRSVDGLQQQLRDALQTRPAEDLPRTPTGGITQEDLLNDPILGPLAKQLQEAVAKVEAHEARLGGHEKYVLEKEYRGQLFSLGDQYNRRYNPDGQGKAFDQKAFLDFTIQRGLTDLDAAYQAWSRPDEIAQVTKEAEARGEERGKSIARVPVLPFGRRRAPERPKDLPADFQSVTEDQIASDPEIIEAMEKDAAG
jgi:phage baseplate assembly protein W